MSPRFTVTVTNQTQGWTLTAVEGASTDPDTTPVILSSPLTYTWDFTDELIPGQLAPFVANVSVRARDASYVPECQVGDQMVIDVRLGTTGPRIIAPYPMRVAEPTVTLEVPGKYRAQLTIPLVDVSADWTTRLPGYNGAEFSSPGDVSTWRQRMASVGYLCGFSVGCPTSWAIGETPAGSFGLYPLPARTFDGDAVTNLNALLNSHQPGTLTHTFVTCFVGDHPAGYRYIGNTTSGTARPDPGGVLRIEAVPASRRLSGAAGLPFKLTLDGTIGLQSRQATTTAAGAMTQLGINARWCDLPVSARRSRAGLVNTVNITGKGVTKTAQDDGTYKYEFVDQPYVASDGPSVGARGTIAREVPTQLYTGPIGFYDEIYGPTAVEPAVVAPLFLADSSVSDAPWAYDGFTVISSRVPDDVAAWLLPRLAPRLPGETDGDGRLVRHVTLYNLDPGIRFNGQPAAGFITGGTMTISGGDITWNLTTAPGRPVWIDTPPTALTVAQFDTAFGTKKPTDLAAAVRVGDLAYTSA